MKHTKGPWEISKIGNNYDQYSVYSEGSSSGNIVNTVEGEANARLISAAPDMLEALLEAEVVIKELCNGNCLVSILDAISKARGL